MTKKIIMLLSISLFCSFALFGTAGPEQKLFQPEDHLRQVSIGAPQVSPDGKWILYSLSGYCSENKKDYSDLYLLATTGGKPRRLTHSPSAERGYTWSPDGSQIAFAAKREGDSQSQIYILPLHGGEARRLTDVHEGAHGPLWSPDGKTMAFYSSVGELYSPEQQEAFGQVRYAMHPRYHHLGRGWDSGKRQRIFTIELAGGEARQLSDGPCSDEGDHSMTWHPNSRALAFVSNRSPEWWNTIDTDIYQVDLDSTETRRLTVNTGPDHSPAYSPDGRWLAYRSSYEYNYESENYKLHLRPAAGGETRALTSVIDRNVRTFAWAADSRGIYFSTQSEGESNIHYLSLNRPDRIVEITRGRNNLYGWQQAGKGRFVTLAAADTRPPELYLVDQGRFKRLTISAEAPFKDYPRLPSEEIWLTAPDGTRVQG